MTKYLFKSKHLGFRPLQASDLENYAKLDTDPQIRAFFPDGDILSIQQIQENMQKNIQYFEKNHFGVFIAEELKSQKFVGRCGFGKLPSGEIEVGYVFLKEFWGKGYATEALKKLLQWAKRHIWVTRYIVSYTPKEHIASQKVMQKAGMEFYKEEIQAGKTYVYYRKKIHSIIMQFFGRVFDFF